MNPGQTLALDISTLYMVATMVAILLGGLLLYFWRQERLAALAWWGLAYALGGAAIGLWTMAGERLSPALLLALQMIGFIACAMVWNASRVFFGKSVSWLGLAAGAAIWAAAHAAPWLNSPRLAFALGAAIVAAYTVLTAAELSRERRKDMRARWPAIAVPMLHGLVLTMPVLAGLLMRPANGAASLSNGWVIAFAVELMLYAVGTVFIVFMLVAERAVRKHKDAAAIDPLTGVLNRRGFAEAMARMAERAENHGRAFSVLMFDIDHFKSVNDRFGHLVGDDVLQVFAQVVTGNLRITDLVGRVGGEEFAALLPCSVMDARIAAERVRAAFENAGVAIDGEPLQTSVSIGIAGGAIGTPIEVLFASADAALYAAKRGGRNRIEIALEENLSLEQSRRQMAGLARETRVQVAARPLVSEPESV